MRRINSVVILVASVFLAIAGLATAEPLNAVSMTLNEGAQQPCVKQSSFMVAAAADREPAEPGQPVPPKLEGAVIQLGKQLKALPGFVLEKGPKKIQVKLRRAGGGPGGLGATTLSCSCDTQDGSCTLMVQGGVATCDNSSGATCKGDCLFTTIITGLGGAVIQ